MLVGEDPPLVGKDLVKRPGEEDRAPVERESGLGVREVERIGPQTQARCHPAARRPAREAVCPPVDRAVQLDEADRRPTPVVGPRAKLVLALAKAIGDRNAGLGECRLEHEIVIQRRDVDARRCATGARDRRELRHLSQRPREHVMDGVRNVAARELAQRFQSRRGVWPALEFLAHRQRERRLVLPAHRVRQLGDERRKPLIVRLRA